MGLKRTRLLYRGVSRDISYAPWIRLTHGKHYNVEIHTRKGNYRVMVMEGYEKARIYYTSTKDFEKDWCE